MFARHPDPSPITLSPTTPNRMDFQQSFTTDDSQSSLNMIQTSSVVLPITVVVVIGTFSMLLFTTGVVIFVLLRKLRKSNLKRSDLGVTYRPGDDQRDRLPSELYASCGFENQIVS